MYEAAERLTEHCRDRVDDSLRAVLLYSEGGDDVIYLRKDLQPVYESEDFDAVAVTAYELHDDLRTLGAENVDTSRYWATVHVLDEFVAIQFIYDADSGVLVSFDPDVSQSLHDFVRECQAILRE